MKRAIVAMIVLWAGPLTGGAVAQGLGNRDSLRVQLPEPPASRVLDEAGLFVREPARLEAVSQRLMELDRACGWPVYLVVYSGLLGGSPEEQATALHAAWTKVPGEGLVIVYESDTRLVAFGRPLETPVAADGSGQRFVGRIAAYELDDLLNRAVKEAGEKVARTEQVETLVLAVARELELLLARSGGESFTGERLRFVLIVVGGISVIALIALIATRLIGRSERRRRRVHRFPEVLVGMRLGAPYGGGRVIARAFRGSAGESRGGSGPVA